MKTSNRMKLQFDSRSANESFARMAVSAFIAPWIPRWTSSPTSKPAVSGGGDQLHCPRLPG